MCGIVGAINGGKVVKDLLGGLENVEYRGYDSAGIAILADQQILRRRAEGNLEQLRTVLGKAPVDGAVGIGHTRWATHGSPARRNAHPHVTPQVAVVHNGIIENFQVLKRWLEAEGHRFESETDSEVIPHLISHYLASGFEPDSAIYQATRKLQGAYALGIMMRDEPDCLYAARRGSPLVVGQAEHGAYLASDRMALSAKAHSMIYLEDGDLACLARDGISIHDSRNLPCQRTASANETGESASGKGDFDHYMLKEIHEQADVIAQTLEENAKTLGEKVGALGPVERLAIIACGTSFYAGSVAKYWFEKYAALPVDLEIASEYRYREAPVQDNTLALFISQSGETADTLAALEHARAKGCRVASIVNVAGSSIARQSDVVFRTFAGPEIGVASTKAFTTQLAVLAQLAVSLGIKRGQLDEPDVTGFVGELAALPNNIRNFLACSDGIEALAEGLSTARSVLFIGRNTAWPIAMEGALKLKEISYIHAEGFGAGELKHGPIALIDENTPVIALTPRDALADKTRSNVQEVAARGAKVITVGPFAMDGFPNITLQDGGELCNPILQVVPLQLLAYHTARIMGRDVDRPRNLAKSVTVE